MSDWSPYGDDEKPEGLGCVFHLVMIGLGYVFALLCIQGCYH